MGIYLFNTKTLLEYLKSDALQETSHDFGRHHPPDDEDHTGLCLQFSGLKNKKEAKYWRDVGSIDAYWEANMDLVSVDPLLNLYDKALAYPHLSVTNPPARFVFAQEKKGGRLGIALDSIVCTWLHCERRPGAEFRAVAQRPGEQLQRSARFNTHGERGYRQAQPYSPSYHRRGRRDPAGDRARV